MALTQRLEMRQSQALVMTPQLMQAIKLLQLSSLDLAAYVDGELERNPLLEQANEGETDAPAADPGAPEQPGASGETRPDEWLGQDLDASRTTIEERLGTDLENVFPDDGAANPARGNAAEPAAYSEWSGVGAGGRDGEYNLEAYVSAETTLADHLGEQLALAVADPVRRMIGQHLIDLVDEAGYFTGDLDAVAENLGAPIAEVEAVLSVVQTFDPAGVCARSLTECLAIQLKERDRFDPAMQALVQHLELVAKRDFAALRKVCGVDDEDLAEMIGEIRHLNPKPGLAFGSTPVQSVVPDVFVRAGPDGGWVVELNSDTLPKVLINQSYYSKISKTAKNSSEKSYLAECLQTATWLTRALDQRARTILKVATEIVRQQDGFFAHGVRHLRPLNLRTVADAISMHEIDGLAGYRQQVHGDQPWYLRAEVFLHLGDRLGGRGRGALGRIGTPSNQAFDRCRRCGRRAFRRYDRREAARSGHRYRPPDGRQIPRSDADSLFGAAAARKTGAARCDDLSLRRADVKPLLE